MCRATYEPNLFSQSNLEFRQGATTHAPVLAVTHQAQPATAQALLPKEAEKSVKCDLGFHETVRSASGREEFDDTSL